MSENRSWLSRLRDAADYNLAHRVRVKGVRSQLTRPIVSFTFDDFPRSAFTLGAAILEQYGGRGTYYVAGSLCGSVHDGQEQFERGDLAELAARGHEIGDHGYAHWRIPHHKVADWRTDRQHNLQFLRNAVDGLVPSSFAYPFGHASLQAKRHYAGLYGSCRGTTPGINHDMLDLGQLKAICLGRDYMAGLALDRVIAETCARNGWLIFYLHDIGQTPSFCGVTAEILEQVIKACLASDIEILPMRNALARACFDESRDL